VPALNVHKRVDQRNCSYGQEQGSARTSRHCINAYAEGVQHRGGSEVSELQNSPRKQKANRISDPSSSTLIPLPGPRDREVMAFSSSLPFGPAAPRSRLSPRPPRHAGTKIRLGSTL
jgi:hypothetical protein